jgi:molybdopterin biosynthesis enzyme MoaB
VEHEAADVVEVFDNGKLRAYELELNPDSGDIVNQVLNDFNAGFSDVVVLTINKDELEKVRNKVCKWVQSEKLHRIKFEVLKNYFT